MGNINVVLFSTNQIADINYLNNVNYIKYANNVNAKYIDKLNYNFIN